MLRHRKSDPILEQRNLDNFKAARDFEQAIKNNIKYLCSVQGYSIKRLFKDLEEREGIKIARTTFYENREANRNGFMKTILLCTIAKLIGVPVYLLFSPEVERDFERSRLIP